jgi:hypothetical protein
MQNIQQEIIGADKKGNKAARKQQKQIQLYKSTQLKYGFPDSSKNFCASGATTLRRVLEAQSAPRFRTCRSSRFFRRAGGYGCLQAAIPLLGFWGKTHRLQSGDECGLGKCVRH